MRQRLCAQHRQQQRGEYAQGPAMEGGGHGAQARMWEQALQERAALFHDALAARIDQASRWAVFRYIELPKMQGVLLIAVLLRFMDSFMIYTEPFVVTGGGPGSSTTFLSIDLVKMAVGQFDLGPAAAMSLIYFLIILLFSWVFYTVMTNVGADKAPNGDAQ